MLTVEKKPKAISDIDEIFDYFINEAGTAVAIRFVEKTEESFAYLAEYPTVGTFLPPTVRADIRVWRVHDFEKYLIFYTVRKETLTIVRVGHSAQNWMKIPGIK